MVKLRIELEHFSLYLSNFYAFWVVVFTGWGAARAFELPAVL